MTEQEFSTGGVKAEDMKAFWEARLKSLYDKAMATPREELAEPLFWWEIYGAGPFQPGAGTIPPGTFTDQPLLPNRIIQVGEEATIVAIVIVNPFFPAPGPSACDILTHFGAKVELHYRTCNTQTCSVGPGYLNVTHTIQLEPDLCFYVDTLTFTPEKAACLYETNICARICNCRDQPVRPFAAFVRWIYDPDYDLFFGSEVFEFDRPIRFMVSDFS